MNNSTSSRRFPIKVFSIAICFVLVAVIAATLMGIPAKAKAYASTEETADTVTVYVGDIQQAPDGYAEKRMEYIEKLVQVNPSQTIETVIGFNDYYSVESVVEFMKAYDAVVNRVYMWPEGETGRLSLHIEGGNIEDGIKAFVKRVEETGLDGDAQSIEDFNRFLNGEYKVFAITITSTAEVLYELVSEKDIISYADVKYNEEAEAYSAAKSKDTHYVELPAKPDHMT